MSAGDDTPDPRVAMLEAAYGHGSDPVVDLPWPHVPLPLGSVAMEKRGPWMRDYLHPQIADFLAQILQYAPMALPASRGGAGMGRDAVWAKNIEHSFPGELSGFRRLSVNVDGEPFPFETPPTRLHPYDAATLRQQLEPANMNPKGTPDPIGHRPGVLNSETFYDRFDPVMRGVLRNNIYQGPTKPANANGPRTYKDALSDQQSPKPQKQMTWKDFDAMHAEMRRLLGFPELPPTKK